MCKKVFTLIFLCLTACVHEAPKATFDLSAYNFSDFKHKYRKKPIQILISEPNATKFYNSENIIVKDPFNSLSYLGNSQWADRLPNLIQNRLIEAFENSNFFKAVDKPGQRMNYSYELITNIREFNIYVAADNSYHINVSIDAKLLNAHNGLVRAFNIFTIMEKMPDYQNISIYDYASYLNEAFQEITKEITMWSQQHS